MKTLSFDPEALCKEVDRMAHLRRERGLMRKNPDGTDNPADYIAGALTVLHCLLRESPTQSHMSPDIPVHWIIGVLTGRYWEMSIAYLQEKDTCDASGTSSSPSSQAETTTN